MAETTQIEGNEIENPLTCIRCGEILSEEDKEDLMNICNKCAWDELSDHDIDL